MDTLTHTTWSPADGILRTRLSGVLRPDELRDWSDGLERASREIGSGTPFAMLVDLRGYEVGEQDPEIHRVQREIVPTFLARHGFEVGFFRMYEVENTIPPDPSLGRCVAVAHVHHDRNKLELYNERIATARERFFWDAEEAERWLRDASAAHA